MFHDKGIILSSSIVENVKVILALFQYDKPREGHGYSTIRPMLLARPIVRRKNVASGAKDAYKNWMTPREVAALKVLLERAGQLMDEYEEGTLDLCHMLSEDEDAKQLVATDKTMRPTVATAFD